MLVFKSTFGGQPPGKINASLNEKLQAVKWGEYKLGDLFDVLSYKKRFDANKVTINEIGKYPYIVRMSSNNGQKGFINEDEIYLNDGNTISFGQDTATMFYQEKPYFTGDKIKVLKPKHPKFNKKNAQFFIVAMQKPFSKFSWGTSSFNVEIIKSQKIELPVKDGEIDFDFMESFIAELEAQRIAELSAYLTVSGFDNYELSDAELNALQEYSTINWKTFNLEKLFGKSTRGKRLKSADRIVGDLPFVTAGEASEGISAHIGNDVEVFNENKEIPSTCEWFNQLKQSIDFRNKLVHPKEYIALTEKQVENAMASVLETINELYKAVYKRPFPSYGFGITSRLSIL